MQRRAALKSELLAEENLLREIAGNELPLVLVSDLLKSIKLQATDEHNDTIMREAVLQLDNILDEFVNEYQGDTKASFDFIDYVKNVKKTRKKLQFIVYQSRHYSRQTI